MANKYFRELPDVYRQQNEQNSLLNSGGNQTLSNLSNLAVGAGNIAMYVDQNGLRLGGTTGGSGGNAPFSVDMNGNIIANGSNITSINANNITTGTLNAITIHLPNENLATGTAGKLIWTSNARIWGDSNGNIGINAVGGGSPNGEIIFYCTSTQRFALTPIGSGENSLLGGLHIVSGSGSDAGNLDVDGSAHIVGTIQTNQDNMTFNSGGQVLSIRNKSLTSSIDGSNQAHLDWGNGSGFAIDHASSTFFINGTSKTGIVPTSQGYNALYSIESPNVWFMDFCDDVDKIDPMFLEVTEGSPKFIQCIDGTYQVWRKRKGFNSTRFELKTYEQFIKNEKFLNMAK